MITRTRTTTTSDVGFLSWKTSQFQGQIEVAEFLTLGRDPANQIVLDDTFTSARHARIERKPQGFVLRDLRSRNGTFINGTQIVEALLQNGDRLRIGETDLQFSFHRLNSEELLSMQSKNPHWAGQLARLSNIAQSAFPVLLTGPSGSGKDVVAQELHKRSVRRQGPFVSVNCSALSESLVESELFGHVRGSFTGATGDRKGAFEAARAGTLFLDEIGDLPLALQPKLLRALENSQIRPVGADRAVDTDVRIIAATHHDLKRLVLEEKFRADLYFRLHVIQLRTPALFDRMEDFEDLFYLFARRLRVRFSYAAIQKLKQHPFPGNIRELRNIIARAKAYIGSEEVQEADIEHLIDVMPTVAMSPVKYEVDAYRPVRSVIKDLEYEMIRARLLANGGNQRRTAADLGMAKSTLHDRLKAYAIDVEELVAGKGPG